jgi:hypothetical protein
MGAAAALAAIVIALWVGESDRERNTGNKARTSTAHREEFRGSIHPAPSSQVAHPVRSNLAQEVAKRRLANRSLSDPAPESTPKLEQFPSRRDMSEGESLLVRRLNEPSNKEALLESAPSREEVDLSIGSLEVRPLQIPDIEISESKTN